MSKEIIKVTKEELISLDDHTNKIEQQNYKIVALRKKQIYEALKDATLRRIQTSKNISNWIKMLSDKIFNQQTIEDMDLNKAIALFKYVNNINLKVLSESNRLEEVLGKYIDSGVMDTAYEMKNSPTNEREKIKNEILSKLNKMFKDSSDDAVVMEVEEVSLTSAEQVELEEAEKTLEQNLVSMDQEIEIDLEVDLNDDEELD
jgi:hypothetical protein